MATSGEYILPITGKSHNDLRPSTSGYDDLYFSWRLSNSSTGEINWSVYLRSGQHGEIQSSSSKPLTVAINGETVYNSNVSVGIAANMSNPGKYLCSGTKIVGFNSFTVSLQINLSGITWHPYQGNAFKLGITSGSASFIVTGATPTDKSTPPSINVGNIIRDEAPVTFENTIYINSTGTTSNGASAELSLQDSYINLYKHENDNDQLVVEKKFESLDTQKNITTQFQSLTPNTPYLVKIRIKNNGTDGSNTFEYTSNVFYTKSIYPPSKPNNVNISYNTDEPESDSEYILSWSNPTDLGYSGGISTIEGNRIFNVLRFVIDNIYCNTEKLLSDDALSTFIWDTNNTTGSNHMSLRIKQDSDNLNFYWDDLDTPFYTKNNYSLPDDSTLWFSISAQRVYEDRFGIQSYSPLSLNDTLVTSNVVGPIQDQAKVFVLVNGQWKQGKVFVNVNNSWKKAKSVFSKVNNQWLKQKNE